jgi:energy-coupling factor transporter ATP-binding protein EcfA2
MKILDYEFSEEYWKFQKIEFQDTNLIVGDSGAGKTRLLNTMFNLASHVAKKQLGSVSTWKLSLGFDRDTYKWNVSTVLEDNQTIVKDEKLFLNDQLILEREGINYSFNKKTSFKLPKNEMSISSLREEELIKPLFNGFSRMLRRRFFGDELEKISSFWLVNHKLLMKIGEGKDLNELYKADPPLNYRLFILQKYFIKLFERIVSTYKEAFEFIEDIKIINSDKLDSVEIPFSGVPIFCIRERSVNKWIRLDELSSGMQKALLIITDLFALPQDIIYLIDEYENSLGVGAINILPDILFSGEVKYQVFITSHHPYIITRFPVENWYIAHRKGANVRFTYGKELVSRYSFSKQDQYLQLLNDPIYAEGIE